MQLLSHELFLRPFIHRYMQCQTQILILPWKVYPTTKVYQQSITPLLTTLPAQLYNNPGPYPYYPIYYR